jgi:HlyD family secretion protein
MYTVVVDAENRDNVLLPYLTANVRFVVHKESGVLLVPNAALRWSPTSVSAIAPDIRSSCTIDSAPADKPARNATGDASTIVWVPDGTFVRPLELRVGASDGVRTVVTGGNLKEGQQVVTGDPVEVGQAGSQSPFVPRIIKR